MISTEFSEFNNRWTNKAEAIQLNDLADYFDRFFTLYVIFNRLYCETALTLERKGVITNDPNRSLPGKKSATEYVIKLLTGPKLVQELEANPSCVQSISTMKTILDNDYRLVLLRGPRADGDKNRDRELLGRFRSTDQSERALAILEFIYAIRCNTFHGSKQYDDTQSEVLGACISILTMLNRMIFEALNE